MNPKPARAATITALVIYAVAVLFVLAWAQTPILAPSNINRTQAALEPLRSVSDSVFMFSQGGLMSNNNMPWRALGIFALWLCALSSLGIGVSRGIFPAGLLWEERLLFGFGAGYIITGLAVLFAGLAGYATPDSAALIILLALLAGLWLCRRQIAGILRRRPPPHTDNHGEHGEHGQARTNTDKHGEHGAWQASWRAPPPPRPDNWRVATRILLFFLCAFMAAGFLYAMTPPIQSDAMRYHLAAPQEWLKTGRITLLPLNAFSNFPFLPNMHYMIALAWDGPEASQMMHFAMLALVTAGLCGFVRRFVEPLYGSPPPRSAPFIRLVVATMYAGVPAVFIVASWPFVDQMFVFFVFASLYSMLLALRSGSLAAYVFTGVMMGGALGSKYTALIFFGVLMALALIELFVVRPPPDAWRAGGAPPLMARARRFAVFVFVAVLVGSPWFIKNVVLTGNPVYPFANQLFGGGDWSGANARLYESKMREKGETPALTAFFRSPVKATFEWTRYEGQYPGGALAGALIAAAAAVVMLILRYPPREKRAGALYYTAAAAALYYASWFVSYQSNRMLAPFFVMALPLAAVFFHECRILSRGALALALAVALLCAAHGMLWALQWEYLRAVPPSMSYFNGSMSRDEYLVRGLNFRQAYLYLNERVKPDERVLLIGEHRIYGAQFNAIWSDWFDTPAVLHIMRANSISSPAALEGALRLAGVRWILVNETEIAPQNELYWRPRFTAEEWKLLQTFLEIQSRNRINIPPGVSVIRLP